MIRAVFVPPRRFDSSPSFPFSSGPLTCVSWIPSVLVGAPLPPSAALGRTNRSIPHRHENASRPGAARSSSSALAGAAAPPTDSDAPSSSAPPSSPGRSARPKKKQQSAKNYGKESQPGKHGANTGRLRRLPPLQPASEILARAARQTHREVKDDLTIANQRRRAQKRGAQTIDSFGQKLCAPLKQTVQTYRRELRSMHPFEQVVMKLTVRARQKKDGLALAAILDDINEGRKELVQLSKDWIAKIKAAPTARESFENTEEAKEVLGRVFLDLVV